jgi:hypothetical protein
VHSPDPKHIPVMQSPRLARTHGDIPTNTGAHGSERGGRKNRGPGRGCAPAKRQSAESESQLSTEHECLRTERATQPTRAGRGRWPEASRRGTTSAERAQELGIEVLSRAHKVLQPCRVEEVRLLDRAVDARVGDVADDGEAGHEQPDQRLRTGCRAAAAATRRARCAPATGRARARSSFAKKNLAEKR